MLGTGSLVCSTALIRSLAFLLTQELVGKEHNFIKGTNDKRQLNCLHHIFKDSTHSTIQSQSHSP